MWWLRGRWCGLDGVGDAPCPAARFQPARGQRRVERAAIGLAREPGVERFEALGRLEQEQAPVWVDRHLGVQQLRPRVPGLIERSGLGHGQQPQRRVQRAGLIVGLRRVQRAVSPAARFGRQFGGAFTERGRGSQTSAGAGVAGRVLELGGDVLIQVG